jgi:hypothetical protein
MKPKPSIRAVDDPSDNVPDDDRSEEDSDDDSDGASIGLARKSIKGESGEPQLKGKMVS